jgi:hypothetical protein
MRYKNKRAQISNEFSKKSGNDLVTFANGTVEKLTDNIDLPHPTVALDKVTQQTAAMAAVLVDIEGGNTTAENTRLLAETGGILMQSLTSNGHYVEDTANTVAAGDLAKAEAIILSSGYKLKKKTSRKPRDFEVYKTGTGWAHFRVKKTTKKYEIVYWKYGIVTAKGAVPDQTVMHIIDKTEIIITDFPSGAIVAMAHASKEIGYQKIKYKPPAFSHQAEVKYDWSEYIYVVIP